MPHLKRVVLLDPSDRTASAVLGGVIGELEPAAVCRAYREIVKRQPRNRTFVSVYIQFHSPLHASCFSRRLALLGPLYFPNS